MTEFKGINMDYLFQKAHQIAIKQARSAERNVVEDTCLINTVNGITSDYDYYESKHGSLEYYGITVKKAGKSNYCTKEELDELLSSLLKGTKRNPIRIYDTTYELDINNRLHAHLLIGSPPNLWLKTRKGWSVNKIWLETTEDHRRWSSYIRKSARNNYEQEQILLLNESRNCNLFGVV